jgi:high affinity Mn2+ porin
MRTCALIVFAGALLARGQNAGQEQQQTPPPATASAPRQNEPETAPQPDFENWNAYWQATSIGQYHGTFHAPYTGPNSLENYPERDVSLTTTLFVGLRLQRDTQVYFNPEIAGGRGFSGVTGIANFPNGELPRVASATPKPYIARLYIQHDFGFGDAREPVESDANQLGGDRPRVRYTIYAGRFTMTDFFDNNRYSHDPRTQFMGWATMYNGAWDYPADTRGYTWGWVHEFHARSWSLRYGSGAMPTNANGPRFDRRVLRDRGDVAELEFRYAPGGHTGAVRFLSYLNHYRGGSYVNSVRLPEQTGEPPDVNLTRRVGTRKYGFAVNAEQEVAKDAGVFLRLGWSDGKNQDFVFTAMDRLASAGFSITGSRWRRGYDTAATAVTVGGISGIHALYLARGGLDFIIGDGRLNYGPEYVWESYYSARVFPWLFASFDLQRIVNPAYNRDRGPLWAPSIRLHVEAKLRR